jgi:dTMP kinase
MRGALITLEGTEGVGKSTLRDSIHALVASRHTVITTREPGGTPLGEQIRTWLLDSEHASVSAEVEALLMFAARGYHLDNVIRPAMAAGQWVVCDRFTDATLAYQGGGRGLDMGFLKALKAAIQRDLEPDLTILLDAPVEVGFGRIAGRDKDHFERENVEFFERVRSTYLRLAAAEPERIRIVDASLPADTVVREAGVIVRELIERFDRAALPGAGLG